VSRALRICSAHRLPVVARAGGTSLEGHTSTPYGGVVLDFSRMDAILSLRPQDLDVTVQPGVEWQSLNAALAPHGLFFPVDPGPGACIGGMVGTGASGTNAVRYLPMKAHVASLTAVLMDGTVIRTAARARKSSAGYDLTSLLVGSEGTLAVVTEATLRLTHLPPPSHSRVAVLSFLDIASACRLCSDLAARGVGSAVGAVELLDAPMMAAVNAQRGFAYPVRPHLFFKLAGSAGAVAEAAATLGALSAVHGGGRVDLSTDTASAARLWEARKTAMWSAQACHPGKRVATTDVAVPLSALPALMEGFEAYRAVHAPSMPVYAVAHAGDGNAHHFIVADFDDAGEAAQARDLSAHLVHVAQALGGTCTGEHGVGVGKRQYLQAELGPGAIDVMQRIKVALDPLGLLNPGKKVPDGTSSTAALGGCDCEARKP
jgi:D-lactate dehydrogenase (cytochrome)